jgi:general secretion pathway protein G
MLMFKILKTAQVERKNHEAGFTLIELLIVIVVLGILMSMAVPALSGVKDKADTAVAKADLHNIMQSLEMYYLDAGAYPAQAVEADFTTVAESLDELNIKNTAAAYNYVTDADGEEYLISYQAADDEYYYISTAASSLVGPESTAPSL